MKQIFHILIITFVSVGALNFPSKAEARSFAEECSYKIRLHFAARSLDRARYLSESNAYHLEPTLVDWISSRSIGLEYVPHDQLMLVIRSLRHSPLKNLLFEQKNLYFQFDPEFGGFSVEVFSAQRTMTSIPASNQFAAEFLAALGTIVYPTVVDEMPKLQIKLPVGFDDSQYMAVYFGMGLSLYLTKKSFLMSLDPQLYEALRMFFAEFRKDNN